MKKKKLHPADQADRAAIENAVSFAAHLRLSPTNKITEKAATLAEAVAKAAEIAAAHPGRRALVYAISDAGVSIPVPKAMQAAAAKLVEVEQLKPPAAKPKTPKPLGKRAQIEAEARAGTLPPAPDFLAATHTRFRKRLAEIVALAEAGDIDALRAIEIRPVSSSPKAMLRFRDLAVIALEANRSGV